MTEQFLLSSSSSRANFQYSTGTDYQFNNLHTIYRPTQRSKFSSSVHYCTTEEDYRFSNNFDIGIIALLFNIFANQGKHIAYWSVG